MKKNLYIIIENFLKELIEQNKFNVPYKLPSEAQLAQKFSTSKMTAKLALNKLEEQGLIERKIGSGSYLRLDFKGAPERKIAVIFPHFFSKFVNDIAYAIDRYLTKRGILCSFFISGRSVERENELLNLVYAMHFDGILLYPYERDQASNELRELVKKNYPIVLIDRYFKNLDICMVSANHYDSSFQICKMFLLLGRQNILFLTDPIQSASSIGHRVSGFLSVIKQNIISEYKSGILFNPSDDQELEPLIIQYFIEHPHTNAVITTSGALEIHLLHVLQKLKLKIGKDILLALYDTELPGWNELNNIPYIQILQNTTKIGETAAELLISTIQKQPIESQKILIPVILQESSI